MSLINDALKRAREADRQPVIPTETGLQFRPVEPASPARRGVGFALLLAIAGSALLGLFLVWQLAEHRSQTSASSRQEPPPAAPAPASPAPAVAGEGLNSLPTRSLPPDDGGVSHLLVQPEEVAAQPTRAPTLQMPPSSPAVSEVAAVEEPPVTNAPAAVELPAPPPLKLQAVIFRSTNPCVMINGKTLFIGDPIGEFRLAAIGRESATLAGQNQTKVLNLSE